MLPKGGFLIGVGMAERIPSFRKRIFGYLSDWGIALFLAFVVFWGLSTWQKSNVDVPDTAPAWTLTSTKGKEISLSDFEGKTVVLSF